MTNTRIITTLAAAALIAGNFSAVGAAPSLKKPATGVIDSVSGANEEVNTGQDITKPVRRLDIRFQYTNAGDISTPSKEFTPDVYTTTLRLDVPFDLGGGYKISTRFDRKQRERDGHGIGLRAGGGTYLSPRESMGRRFRC
jgi:hypothetical protein